MVKDSRNVRFFFKNQRALARRYAGKVIIVAGGRLIGSCRRGDSRSVRRLADLADQLFPSDAPFIHQFAPKGVVRRFLLI